MMSGKLIQYRHLFQSSSLYNPLLQKTFFLFFPQCIFSRTMAGHSKWAKIHRAKGANDAARASLFSKLSAAISAAARAGGTDVSSNLRLASAIEKARSLDTPKAVIERAISSASTAGADLEEVVFEALGPSRVAIIIETLTNNKKRTTLGLRTLFKKYDTEIQPNGSLSFMFETRGRLSVALPDDKSHDENMDKLLTAATDAEASDVEPGEDIKSPAVVWTTSTQMYPVAKALEASGWKILEKNTLRIANVTVSIPDDDRDRVLDLLADLEDHEDVQAIYHNAAED
jgi:YebC/PmpR family DNA-binding regulatory protein